MVIESQFPDRVEYVVKLSEVGGTTRMTESQEKMMQKLGLTESDLQARSNPGRTIVCIRINRQMTLS